MKNPKSKSFFKRAVMSALSLISALAPIPTASPSPSISAPVQQAVPAVTRKESRSAGAQTEMNSAVSDEFAQSYGNMILGQRFRSGGNSPKAWGMSAACRRMVRRNKAIAAGRGRR